jgi:hypothetical protein
VLAYNVIGQISGYRERLVAALYHTMKTVFPQVYMFTAETSQNIVFIATKSREALSKDQLQERANARISSGIVKLPTFSERLRNFWNTPPPTAAAATTLTDDFNPVESMMAN